MKSYLSIKEYCSVIAWFGSQTTQTSCLKHKMKVIDSKTLVVQI